MNSSLGYVGSNPSSATMHTLFSKRIRTIHLHDKYDTIVYRIYCKDGFIIELLESRDKSLINKLKKEHQDRNYFLVVGGRKCHMASQKA